MSQTSKLTIKDFSFYYGSSRALRDVTFEIKPNEIFAIFGPSQSGKTTLLKSLNRLTELTPGGRRAGNIFLDGSDIYDPKVNLTQLRRRTGPHLEESPL
jgi:phosphate transport system ATP-binding protein